MNISVTFRNLESTEAIKAHINEKVGRVRKFLQGPVEAQVVLSVERYLHGCDVTISAGNMVFKGREETEDMYTSIDKVMDKVEKQIRKSKGRVRASRGSANHSA